MTSPVPEPPFDPRQPFLSEMARAAGISANELRSTRWHQVFKGVHVSSAVPLDARVRVRAALLLHPPAAHASHTSAAKLHRVPVPRDPDIHVTVRDQLDRRPQPGLRPHTREAGSQTVLIAGMRVSSPLQLFVELAGQLSLVDAVVAGDAMIRLKLFTLRQLSDHCDAARGKQSRRARRAAAYVREGVDSPMETRLRMLIVLAGLPEPVVNLRIIDDDGVLLRRLDLSYPELRLLLEFDGRHHIERVAQWESDLTRREEFDEDGWGTLIFTGASIYVEPGRSLHRVRKALRARGVTVRRLNPRWQEHFPGR